MKVKLAMLVVVVFAALPAVHAQCLLPNIPDVWLWGYSGDQVRGGVLPFLSADQVSGTAYTSNGIPFNIPGFPPPPPWMPICTFATPVNRQFGDALVLENLTFVCAGINYSMRGSQTSYRPDGLEDHLVQVGIAFGSNPGDANTPAYYEQVEAGSLAGNNGSVGVAKTTIDRTGLCVGVAI